MSHDLDRALRDSLRRHAESAPTVIDTDGIRLRAKKIQRRRVTESVTAAFAALVVAGGIAFAVSSLRTDAGPPPVTTVTPAPNPGNLAPLAYSNGDGNNPTRLIVRVAGVDTVVPNPTPAEGPLSFVGWYGPDHRTLVMASGAPGFREGTLSTVSLGADGRITGSPKPLTVPGLPSLGAGVVYPVRGGPIQFWMPLAVGNPNSPSTLVTIAPDLASGTSRPMPTGLTAVAVTADHALLVSPGTSALSVASLAGSGTPTPEPVRACARLTAAQTSLDGTKVALGCGDGTIDLLTLADRSVTRLAAVPELTPEVGPLGVWWDPSGGVHVSTTPTGRADYTEVHSWDWNGTTWARGLDGLLTRTYPLDAPSARFMKENAAPGNNGRWIVESTPEVDLGPAGDTLALAPSAEPAPSPTPSTTSTLPPAPASPPWTAVTRDYQPANSPPLVGVMVNIGGRTRQVGEGDNAQTEIAGWSGTGRRTLVWGVTQDYPGDQGIRTASFNADGTVAAGPADLAIPSDPRVVGRPFVLADGRLVVWRIGAATAGAAQGKLLRFTADLSDASVTDLPPGDPVFATSKYVGVQPDSTTLLVVGARGSGKRTLPECPGYSATVSQDEEFVAISCAGGTIEVLDLPTVSGDSGAAGGVTRLPAFPDKSTLVSTWFDPAGQLFASTTTSSGEIATWSFGGDQGDQWTRTRQQGVVDRVFPGGGYALALYADPSALLPDAKPYTWLTETDPALDLAVVGTEPGASPSIAARGSG